MQPSPSGLPSTTTAHRVPQRLPSPRGSSCSGHRAAERLPGPTVPDHSGRAAANEQGPCGASCQWQIGASKPRFAALFLSTPRRGLRRYPLRPHNRGACAIMLDSTNLEFPPCQRHRVRAGNAAHVGRRWCLLRTKIHGEFWRGRECYCPRLKNSLGRFSRRGGKEFLRGRPPGNMIHCIPDRSCSMDRSVPSTSIDRGGSHLQNKIRHRDAPGASRPSPVSIFCCAVISMSPGLTLSLPATSNGLDS